MRKFNACGRCLVWSVSTHLAGFAASEEIKYHIGSTDITDMTVKPSQFDTLSQLIHASEQRHKVISNNIANVNTPGYIRREL